MSPIGNKVAGPPHWLKREDMISQQIMGTIMELALFCFSELKEYEVFGS